MHPAAGTALPTLHPAAGTALPTLHPAARTVLLHPAPSHKHCGSGRIYDDLVTTGSLHPAPHASLSPRRHHAVLYTRIINSLSTTPAAGSVYDSTRNHVGKLTFQYEFTTCGSKNTRLHAGGGAIQNVHVQFLFACRWINIFQGSRSVHVPPPLAPPLIQHNHNTLSGRTQSLVEAEPRQKEGSSMMNPTS